MPNIPSVDFERLHNPAERTRMDAACRDWGFFHLRGAALDTELRAQTLVAMRAFFALPSAQKRAIERSAENPWGFYDRELTKNRRDWKEIFDFGPDIAAEGLPAARAQWPSELPEFRAVMLAFYAACESVAQRLLAVLSANLGMPEEHLSAGFGADQTSFLRLNYYPLCDDPAPADTPTEAPNGNRRGELGIHHHTDAGALTVLLQDAQPGLQVLREERWHLIEPDPDALVINIGDIVQVWSNDLYRAPLHRVLASSNAERYSAPFFFNPSYSTRYAPLLGVCSAERPARYRAIEWAVFRAARAAGDYADVGEEVQIGRYRVREGEV